MEHYRLENLAIEAFGNHVSDQLWIVLSLMNSKNQRHIGLLRLDSVCQILKEQVQSSVAPSLANLVTATWVRFIYANLMRYLKTLRTHVDYTVYRSCLHEGVRLAVQVACAVTHPSVTVLRYHKICDEYSALADDFMALYYEQVLSKSRNLEDISFQFIRVPLQIPGSAFQNLKYFNAKRANDSVLETLGNWSKGLRTLDLGDCSFLSNGGVASILKFRNLNHLNISCAKLSSKDKERLFRGFKNAEEDKDGSSSTPRTPLTYLSLTIMPEDVTLISECLPHINTLDLHLLENVDLTPLKDLNQLAHLSISGNEDIRYNTCVRDLIEEIGPRLLSLKLKIETVNLKQIERRCTSLKTFGISIGLSGIGLSDVPIAYSQFFPKMFKTVCILELAMFGKQIWRVFPYYLSSFANAKKLKVATYAVPEDGDVSLEEVLLRPLKEGRFEQVMFNEKRLQMSGERVVVTSVHGYGITIGKQELESVVRQINQRHPIQYMRRNSRVAYY